MEGHAKVGQGIKTDIPRYIISQLGLAKDPLEGRDVLRLLDCVWLSEQAGDQEQEKEPLAHGCCQLVRVSMCWKVSATPRLGAAQIPKVTTAVNASVSFADILRQRRRTEQALLRVVPPGQREGGMAAWCGEICAESAPQTDRELVAPAHLAAGQNDRDGPAL